MLQKELNLLATASAELYALGDDENSGKIMSAVECLITANGMTDEAFDQANEVFISMRDKLITEIPDIEWPGDAEHCIATMLEGSEELSVGAELLNECVVFLKDYWAERMQVGSDTFEE